MSILKAVFLTLFIVGIEALIQILIFVVFPTDGSFSNHSLVYGFSLISGRLAAYFLVFIIFLNVPFQKIAINTKSIKGYPLFLLSVIVVGFELITRPILDIKEILTSFDADGLLPYRYEFAGYTPNFAFRTITALLIAPILEELFFRKYLLTGLMRKYNKIVALVVSGILFSLIHWEIPINLLPSFIFGIVSGLVYIRTKNIIYSIVLHLFVNLLSVFMEINGSLFYDWLFWLNFGLIYWVLCATGVVFIILALRKIKTFNHDTLKLEVNPEFTQP